ncbi:hypothetical protein MUG87_19230 [Ectobacillus sp. JY-23]|uniref:hypothetical protein n=1 Tax=Ectobacillus sp. JY-23 TaxID=2933872 RepID=UPI001FF6E5BE|nr:hypothetical protein [Ectobacillus sp. JY-23]UOY92517.1 hypothetical protein MUG87_19230 [Ectobacillus sp. JY-23]
MTTYLDPAAMKKLLAEKDTKQKSEAVVTKAVAPVKGEERVGVVVYRSKAEYGIPFEQHA